MCSKNKYCTACRRVVNEDIEISPDTLYLSTTQLSHLISVKRASIAKWVERGKIPTSDYKYELNGRGHAGKELFINPLAIPEKYRKEYLKSISKPEFRISESYGFKDWLKEGIYLLLDCTIGTQYIWNKVRNK